jgi:hypothetical protein
MLSCISSKATSLREQLLLAKNKKSADRAITYPYGAMERKNILAEIDYRF